MLKVNLKKGIARTKSRARLNISLLELIVYIGSGLYYTAIIAFIMTVIVAGWKYILS